MLTISVHWSVLFILLQDGWTPLHGACQEGHYQVAELLLQAGASVEQETKVRWDVGRVPQNIILSEKYLLYSLKITPPLNISPPSPPLLFVKICCGSIFIFNLGPPDHFLLDEIFHLTSNLQWSTRTSLSSNGPCTLKHFDKLCDDITTAHEIFSCKKLLNDWCLVAFRLEL